MTALSSGQMEIAVMRYFNPRLNICVPNISWGLDLHECDMLVLTPSGIAYEVEIKVSRADLLKDKSKSHGHYNKKIGRLYFCVPAALADFAMQHIPERAGLLTVESPSFLWARKAREAKLSGDYRWTSQQRYKLMHLGCMRLLPLIENLQRRHNDDEQIVRSEIGL
jgi:hypothetical protein